MLSHAYSLHVRHVCPSTAVHHIYPFIPRIILKRRLSHIIHLLNSSTSAHQAAPPRPLLRLCRLNTHAQKLISNDTLLQAFGAGLTFTRSRKSIRNRLQVCLSPKLVLLDSLEHWPLHIEDKLVPGIEWLAGVVGPRIPVKHRPRGGREPGV